METSETEYESDLELLEIDSIQTETTEPESADTTQDQIETLQVSSPLISILEAPTKSDLARKRKVEKPKPTAEAKKRKSTVPNQTDPLLGSITYVAV